jgi:hypothetical protein
VVRQKNCEYCPELAQSDDDRRVAGWTVDKFKNGALSAVLPFGKFEYPRTSVHYF